MPVSRYTTWQMRKTLEFVFSENGWRLASGSNSLDRCVFLISLIIERVRTIHLQISGCSHESTFLSRLSERTVSFEHLAEIQGLRTGATIINFLRFNNRKLYIYIYSLRHNIFEQCLFGYIFRSSITSNSQ